MPDRQYRVLFVASHPVQYQAPLFRRLAAHPELDIHVAYCSLRGAEEGFDPEFETTVRWDLPLLEGYAWTHVPNRGSGAETFFGLWNPDLWKLVREGNFDAVVCYVVYVRASFWLAYLSAKFRGGAFLFGTDAHSFVARDGRAWKAALKKIFWRRLFGLADQVCARSSRTRDLLLSAGIPEERITLVSSVVDNDWWREQSAKIDRRAVRISWGVSPEDFVILFCAKLQPWKRPLDVLEAFAKIDHRAAALVFAGDGPLREALEKRATELGVRSRVRFLGFVNQGQLPGVYASSDVMVLPSEYEPFGLVVNEAYCCACPVIASDRVGATRDLVAPVHGDFIFPCGDVDALAGILRGAIARPGFLKDLGQQAAARMRSWSPEQYIAEIAEAVSNAVARRNRGASARPADASVRQTTPAGREGFHQ